MMERLMSQQDEINADVAELQSALTAIQGKLGSLQDEIVALEAQVAAGGPVDLTGLKSVADELAAVVPPVAEPGGDGGETPAV